MRTDDEMVQLKLHSQQIARWRDMAKKCLDEDEVGWCESHITKALEKLKRLLDERSTTKGGCGVPHPAHPRQRHAEAEEEPGSAPKRPAQQVGGQVVHPTKEAAQ